MTSRKGEVKFLVSAQHLGQAGEEIEGRRAKMLQHSVAAGIGIFESNQEHASRFQQVGSVDNVSSPRVIRDVVQDMTEHGHAHADGQVGCQNRAVDDVSFWIIRSKFDSHFGVWLNGIHCAGPFQEHACQISRTGPEINGNPASWNLTKQFTQN